jgi:hypothetical protein
MRKQGGAYRPSQARRFLTSFGQALSGSELSNKSGADDDILPIYLMERLLPSMTGLSRIPEPYPILTYELTVTAVWH